jgi:hypothetical protein
MNMPYILKINIERKVMKYEKEEVKRNFDYKSKQRQRHNSTLMIILAIITFLMFIKMCQVTLDSKVKREPLREIYDSRP